eukprot:4303129-Pyramimonas_sp.AAC.1
MDCQMPPSPSGFAACGIGLPHADYAGLEGVARAEVRREAERPVSDGGDGCDWNGVLHGLV